MAQNEPIRGPAHGPAINAPAASPDIPDKLYFRIGDVSRICDLPAYVLRFWETEFPQLKPNKGGTGQRLYRRRDVETVLRIKRLLYDEGYTIPGARQLLKSEVRRGSGPQLSLLAPEPPESRKLRNLRRELEAIVSILSRPIGSASPSSRAHRRAPGLQPSPKRSPLSPLHHTGEIPFE